MRAMLETAQCEKDGPVSLKHISDTQDISKKYLSKLFNRLKNAGLVISIRGPKGGYLLSREPDKIPIGAIIRAVEGPIATVRCVMNSTHERCSRIKKCVCHLYWERLEEHITNFLDSSTLFDLCEEARNREIARSA